MPIESMTMQKSIIEIFHIFVTFGPYVTLVTSGESEVSKTPHYGVMHPASSKSCTRFLYEKEVQAIRVLEKVSFKEARRKALERQFRPGESFASVIRRVKIDIQQEKQHTKLNSQQDINT